MANQSTPDDADLVRAAQRGKLEAFTALYERYLPRVHNRVRCTIPVEDVEDVTQEVFIAVMRSLGSFRHEAQFSTWLRTLVSRQIADYYRRRKPQEASLDLSNPAHDRFALLGVQDDARNLDNLIILRQGLAELPDHYREVILLRFADGLKFDEIAQVQGQSLEATKSLYRRAIAALQKQIKNG